MEVPKRHLLFLKELGCPVCFEYISQFVRVGTTYASAIKPKTHQCPTCRQEFLQTCKLSMDRLSRHVILHFPNRRVGCPEVLALNLLLPHKKVCLLLATYVFSLTFQMLSVK
jgi:hypothetical protein